MTETFNIWVTETLCREIEVEAESAELALEEARRMYDEGEIVLDSGDYVDVEMKLV